MKRENFCMLWEKKRVSDEGFRGTEQLGDRDHVRNGNFFKPGSPSGSSRESLQLASPKLSYMPNYSQLFDRIFNSSISKGETMGRDTREAGRGQYAVGDVWTCVGELGVRGISTSHLVLPLGWWGLPSSHSSHEKNGGQGGSHR